MNTIQKATEGMTAENLSFSESEFISHLDKQEANYGNFPILFAATPGMGKSTLLQSLARNIIKKYSGTKTALFVVFSDLVNLLKPNTRNASDISTAMFENALVQLTSECGPELGKYVLESILYPPRIFRMLKSPMLKPRNKINLELMLDGYDEINSDDLPLAKEILTLIRKSYHSTRIWVASRPHLMLELEDELQVIGFTIHPFDESDQENFLVEFWQAEIMKEEASSNFSSKPPQVFRTNVITFARHCLETVKRVWVKKSEKKDICGVPLQCLLLSIVYLDDCLTFANTKKLTSNSKPRLSLQVSSVKDLYEALIVKKLKIYTRRYAKQLSPEMKTTLINIHYGFALELLYPKDAPNFKAGLLPYNVLTQDILNLGIMESPAVESKNNSLIFGHRTIPEFLVARFVAEQLCEDENDNQLIGNEEGSQSRASLNHCTRFPNYHFGNLLFDGVLRTLEFNDSGNSYPPFHPFHPRKFENQASVIFLDSLLEGRSLLKSTRLDAIVAGRSRRLTQCIEGDHFHLFKALRTGLENLCATYIHTTVTKASQPFLEYICNEYRVKLVEWDVNARNRFPQLSFFNAALKSREFSVVEFLLNCQGYGKLVQDLPPSIEDVVHAVVVKSSQDPEWLIEQKIHVMRKLVDLNRNVLEGRLGEFISTGTLNLVPYGESIIDGITGTTPALQPGVHIELLLELLDLGGNPLTKRADNSTLLHVCTQLSGKDFHRVVTRLTEEQGKELIKVTTKNTGSTVLHKIAENMRQPKKETLEHLLKLGANFAGVNANGQTCLHTAATFGNVEAARLFLELGMKANAKNGEGRTPLDHLLLNQCVNAEHLEEIGQLMISYGATLSTDSGTTIHHVVSRGRKGLLPVRFLLKHFNRVDINARDGRHNTPLHTCMRSEHEGMFEMAEMLFENGAAMEAKNHNGETPFQILVRRRPCWDNVKVMSLFLKKGAAVGSVKEAQVAFLNAILCSDSLLYEEFEKLANALLNQGADIRNADRGGNALLNELAEKKVLNGVKYLLAKGVSVNGVHEGKTALHACLSDNVHCDPKIVKYLLDKGANVHARDSDGLTPLERWLNTTSEVNLEVILFFVDNGQQATPLKREDATRILFQVVKYDVGSLGDKELLGIAQSKLLAAANFCELRKKRKGLLHYAAKRSRASMVRLLLQKGAGVNAKDERSGRTPLHFVLHPHKFEANADEVVATLKELLLSTEVDAKAVDQQGNTILDLALLYHSATVVQFVLETGHFDKKLFSRRTNSFSAKVVNLRELFSRYTHVTGRNLQDIGRNSNDPRCASLLHAAVACGNDNLVAYLLEKKLFTLSPLSEEELPRFAHLIHLCVGNTLSTLGVERRMNIIRMLVHHNKDLLNSKDTMGRTPLLAENVDVSLLVALVELGADVKCVDQKGKTVSQVAATYMKTEDYDILAKVLRRRDSESMA